MHRCVVLSRVVDGRGCSKNAGFVLVAPVLLSPDRSVMSCCVDEVMCRLAVDVVAGGEICGSDVNECTDVADETVRQLVENLVAGDEICDSGVNGCIDVDNEGMHRLVEDVVADGEVCGSDVIGCSLLFPGLLSPDS